MAPRQALARIVDQLGGIEVLLHTQAVAGGAGTGWVVEGEDPRFELRHGVTALGAGEIRREGHGFNPSSPSMGTTSTMPPERVKAVSKDSARRRARSRAP